MAGMKLELSLRASQLKNVSGPFKHASDPFALVSKVATTEGAVPEVLGKTEVIRNSLSPEWVKVFSFDYELGTPIKLAIFIFDEGKKGNNKPMGSGVFEVGEVLGARGNIKAKKLIQGGTLFVSVRKNQGSGLLRLTMKGNKLRNVEGFFGKSNPFFELGRMVDVAGCLTWQKVYRSEIKKSDLNPEWDAAVVPLDILCGGDLNLSIQVSFYDLGSNGKRTVMGKFETTVNELHRASRSGVPFHLQNKTKDVGAITVLRAEVSGVETIRTEPAYAAVEEGVPSVAIAPACPGFTSSANFIDYIAGGCEFRVVVAIDFTASNGDPHQPGTLHFIMSGPNDYEKAIQSIVGALSPYDLDQKFAVVGFGARYDGVVRHCFQCGPTPDVQGVQGILEAYRAVFRSGLVMSGPTDINEVVEMAADRARWALNEAQQNGHQAYTVLLILTDGAVSDINWTAQGLDRAMDSPMSIVIVGIGNEDFDAMQFLDERVENSERDYVQFIEFNKCANSSELSAETLREIPDQLVDYFQKRGIPPSPAIQRDYGQIIADPEEEEIDWK